MSDEPLNTRGGTPLSKGARPTSSGPAPRHAPRTPPASNPHSLWRDQPDSDDQPEIDDDAPDNDDGTPSKIKWLKSAPDNNAKDAINFLSLVRRPKRAAKMMDKLTERNIKYFKAKDILRAAQLAPLPDDDPDVQSKLDQIKNGTPQAPIYLLRGSSKTNRPLQIADGYHRVCAANKIDPTTPVACQIIRP